MLPFADLSPLRDHEYFCHGITEEIISTLAGVPGLRVISRTSAFAFRDQDLDVTEIGRRLRVGTALEGSVRRSGDRLRVTAQLVDADNGYQLWSQRFDREPYVPAQPINSGLITAIHPETLSDVRTLFDAVRMPLLAGLPKG